MTSKNKQKNRFANKQEKISHLIPEMNRGVRGLNPKTALNLILQPHRRGTSLPKEIHGAITLILIVVCGLSFHKYNIMNKF